MSKFFLAFTALCLTAFSFSIWPESQTQQSALRSSQFDSFNEVWRQVSLNPWSASEMPHYSGVSTEDLIELLVKKGAHAFNGKGDMLPWKHEGKIDFGKRTRELFTNSANFKEAGTKWLHPRGVCARGTWQITEDSPATGLFARGTEVPMVMRLSSGTEASERYFEGEIQARIFGIAIKLFHDKDLNKDAITSNIVTLDHRGFSRSDRAFINIPKPGEELFFTNVSPVENIIGSRTPLATFAGKLLSRALDLFDDPNFARPVYVSASYDDQGQPVSQPITPFKLKFIPRFAAPKTEYSDFREELLNYSEGSFDIVISQLEKGKDYGDRKIGEITLDYPMVMTSNCDTRLAFHHSPVEWKEKYEDKSMVRFQCSSKDGNTEVSYLTAKNETFGPNGSLREGGVTVTVGGIAKIYNFKNRDRITWQDGNGVLVVYEDAKRVLAIDRKQNAVTLFTPTAKTIDCE